MRKLRWPIAVPIAVFSVAAIAMAIWRLPGREQGEPVAARPINLAIGDPVQLRDLGQPVVVKSFDFDTGGDAEGWQIWTGVKRLTVADGGLRVEREAAPSAGIMRPVNMMARDANVIQMRVFSPTGSIFHCIWWRADGGSQTMTTITSDSAEDWQVLSFRVGRNAKWQDRIERIGLAFENGDATPVIDWIRLVKDNRPYFVKRPDGVGYAIENELAWVLPVEIPGRLERSVVVPDRARLTYSCGLSRSAWRSLTDDVRFRVLISVAGRSPRVIDEATVRPKETGGAWTWVRRSVELLHGAAGTRGPAKGRPQAAMLTFEVSSPQAEPGMVAVWGNPTLTAADSVDNAAQPNVLVLLVDAMRPDHMSAYGYDRPTTPNIDRIAGDGLVFENAFAQTSATHVSVGSLFMSLYPVEAKDADRGFLHLRPQSATMARRFREADYATGGFSANPFVHWDYGMEQGFEWFVFQRESQVLTERLLTWLKARDERPWFAYLHLMGVHDPYAPPEPFRSRFAVTDYTPRMPEVEGGQAAEMRINIDDGVQRYSERDREYLKALYDAEIACSDDLIGEIVDALRRSGAYDDTAIVVCADHGEEFLEHGSLQHARTLYDESIRVPLILKLPGTRQSKKALRTDAPVRLVDVYPTLLEIAGIPYDARIRGAGLLGAKAGEARPVYAEIDYLRALRTDRWKLIVNTNPEAIELYDLEADPGETKNVAGAHPDVVEQLKAQLSQVQSAVSKTGIARARRYQPDQKTQERLRSLGYIR